jgi:hypothetical protein
VESTAPLDLRVSLASPAPRDLSALRAVLAQRDPLAIKVHRESTVEPVQRGLLVLLGSKERLDPLAQLDL